MTHRGPDGQGIFRRPGVGLGHRRLAIIDVSGGSQPMSTPDGRFWITYNGEVYNFRDLRQELGVLGHSFRSESDTEVVLLAYATWGPKCVERLSGMFAFAIWDSKERSLFLARDHLGIKPLFCHVSPEGLTFASDLRGLLEDPDVPQGIDPLAVSDYLSLGYILAPKTIFRGVEKLLPGHAMVWTPAGLQRFCFWDLAAKLRESSGGMGMTTEATLVDELRARLGRVVDAQMVSDVPVGAFLSGGVDSSAVVGFMVGRAAEPIQTFSVGFEERSYSELGFARVVARYLRTEHQELVVRPELDDLLPKIARSTGEPLGDSSLLPTYLVAELARRKVKVVLSGDGGDEAFGGYDTYVADRLHGLYRRLPGWVRHRVIEPAVAALPVTHRKVSFDYKARQFVAAGEMSREEAHYSWRGLFSEAAKRELLPQELLREIGEYRPFDVFARYFRDVAGAEPLAQAQYVDLKTWLADDILVKVDRASMAHSVETRVPLLDRELVELALALPRRLKIRGFRKKYALKAAVAPLLPSKIVNRRKSGFTSPVGPWTRGTLRPLLETAVLDGDGVVPFRRPALRSLLDEHLAGQKDHGYRLWALLMLQLWGQTWQRRP
jgi:asparagine synthase (glutamine-hydrolysing)